MAKVNFLNQVESVMSEKYISQLHGNSYNKTRKWRYFIQEVMKKKIQIEARQREVENECFENKATKC